MRFSVSFFSIYFLLVPAIAHSIPADPASDPVPVEVRQAIPEGLEGYLLLRDNIEKIIYVAPRYGKLAVERGLPLLSLANIRHEGIDYAVLNAAFDFKVDKEDFRALKSAIQSTGWAIAPMPFESTSGTLSINSRIDGEESGICGKVTNPVTGEIQDVCSSFVVRSLVALKGPTLGQLYNVQMVLTASGANLYSKLLKGGNGLSFNMEANYHAAFPAYSAKIQVDYKKLSESYDMFAAVHDSNCFDIQVSDFFKRESICSRREDGSYKTLNGGDCSITVTYTNHRGEKRQNLFQLPNNYSNKDMKTFAAKYNDEIRIVHDAIEGLRLDFERKMLEKYPTASVDKSVNYNYIARADRKRFEDEVHVTLERKTIGGAVIRSTTIPGIAACVQTNPNTGDVTRYGGNQDCVGFWNNEVKPLELLSSSDTEAISAASENSWWD